jgi:hypothetical protein
VTGDVTDDDSTFTSESGVTTDGRPFVKIRWGSKEGTISPFDAKSMSEGLLMSALSAEYDAAVVRSFIGSGRPVADAAAFLGAIRDAMQRDTAESSA